MAFSNLTVCSGNVCRSPLTELLLRQGLASLPDVKVSRAGTVARVGLGMTDDGQSVASEHRSAVADLHPQTVRRAFVLSEFANIARSRIRIATTCACCRSTTSLAGWRRSSTWRPPRGGVVEHLDEDDLDVMEPYRRGQEVYELPASPDEASDGCDGGVVDEGRPRSYNHKHQHWQVVAHWCPPETAGSLYEGSQHRRGRTSGP